MTDHNVLGRHEVLHMSYYFMLNIETYLLQHPEVQKVAEWEELARTAHEALCELYQAIGSATIEKIR